MTTAQQWAARWADGRSRKVPASVVAAEIAAIEATKSDLQEGCTPGDLVNAARPMLSPIHSLFEWNDSVAAEQYREVQAGRFIRNVRFVSVPVNNEPAVQRVAFISVGHGYKNIEVVLNSAPLRDKMLADAKAQLFGWQARYGHLSELAAVAAQIQALRP